MEQRISAVNAKDKELKDQMDQITTKESELKVQFTRLQEREAALTQQKSALEPRAKDLEAKEQEFLTKLSHLAELETFGVDVEKRERLLKVQNEQFVNQYKDLMRRKKAAHDAIVHIKLPLDPRSTDSDCCNRNRDDDDDV